MKRLSQAAVPILIWMVTACQHQATVPPEPAQQGCGEATTSAAKASSGGAYATASTDEAHQITFYRDILPILSSNAQGKVYKCTTCHAQYAQPENVASVDIVESIVKSLKEGRMPRTGSPVSAAEIELFTKWQLMGFQTGEKLDFQPLTSNGCKS